MAPGIRVKSPDGEYPILIEPGILERAGALAARLGLDRPVVVTTNDTVASLYGELLARSLPSASLVVVADGEQFKTLETVREVYSGYIRAGLDRTGVVLALGGGVIGDLAGFAAATYMRGVRLVQMPTTLLAMVDSSVGGKVGVDLPEGKNLVGAFKQPDCVIIDLEVLRTLPERELRCGMAEVIKHGLIADATLLETVMTLHAPPNWLDDRILNTSAYFAALPELIERAVRVKIAIVEQDPYEQNVRAFLNLGHTFAHAIEQVSGYTWPHGEAVGVGLLAAARLSHRLGLCSAALVDRVAAITAAAALPHRIHGLNSASLFEAMATDKKWRSGRSRFVLLEDIGKPVIVEDVSRSDVLAVLESLS